MRRTIGRRAWQLHGLWQRLRDKTATCLLAGAFEDFGRRSTLCLPIRLGDVSGVSIGSRVMIGASSWIETVPGEGGQRARIRIADGVVVAGSCVLSAATEIRLEEDVLLARNVYISDHIHRYDRTELPIVDQGIDKLAPVRIGRGAWLGQNVVVCPGVTIGAGAVIGANSVVNQDIPAHSVAVGSPARVIRQFGPGAGS